MRYGPLGLNGVETVIALPGHLLYAHDILLLNEGMVGPPVAASEASGGHSNGFTDSRTLPDNCVAIKRRRGENTGLHHSFFGGRVTVGASVYVN